MFTLKPRNPFAHAPQLKKGGAHQRSASGSRFGQRQALLAELDDYYQQTCRHAADDDDSAEANGSEQPGCGPVFLRLRPTQPYLPPLRIGT